MKEPEQERQLLDDAASSGASVRVGDYLEADGQKQHELLFEANEVCTAGVESTARVDRLVPVSAGPS